MVIGAVTKGSERFKRTYEMVKRLKCFRRFRVRKGRENFPEAVPVIAEIPLVLPSSEGRGKLGTTGTTVWFMVEYCHSSCLKIQRFERNLSHHLLLFIIIDLLQLGQLFAAYFMYLLVAFLSKGRACSTEVAGFSAAEAEFLFDAAFALFWGELGDLDRIHDHGVGVVGLGVGGIREGVVGLMGRP